MKKYRVVSGSMMPVIPIGMEIFLEEVSFLDLKKFDIIVFNDSGKYTCHYIWHINKHLNQGMIITRNLDGYKFDDPFAFDQVVGRVTNVKLPLWIKLKLLFWIK